MTQSCGVHILNTSCLAGVAGNTSGGPDVEVVFELYLTSVFCVIGLVGNIGLFVVLQRDVERRQTLLLLQALAIADSLYLITSLIRFPLKHLMPNNDAYTTMQLYVFPLLKTCQCICIWMMVLVTIDRFIYVCYPMRALRLFSLHRKQVLVVMTFVLGFVYNIPRFFDQCILQVVYACTNVTVSHMLYTPMFRNPLYFSVYQHAMYVIFVYLVPLVVIGYMNIRLILAIRASRRRHSFNGFVNTQYTENNATFVLIIIIAVFIICETPELILKILTIIQHYTESITFFSQMDDHTLHEFAVINEFFMVLNSSVNFFIYILLSRRFRQAIRRSFDDKSPFSTHVETLPLR